MALLVIVDKNGKSHLIHSSQIGLQRTPIKALGEWRNVWARVDKKGEST